MSLHVHVGVRMSKAWARRIRWPRSVLHRGHAKNKKYMFSQDYSAALAPHMSRTQGNENSTIRKNCSHDMFPFSFSFSHFSRDGLKGESVKTKIA